MGRKNDPRSSREIDDFLKDQKKAYEKMDKKNKNLDQELLDSSLRPKKLREFFGQKKILENRNGRKAYKNHS